MVGLMHFEKVKIGMKVKITSVQETNKAFNSNDTMKDMVGGIYTVSEILTNHKTGSHDRHPFKIKFVEQSRFVWLPDDLEYAGPPMIQPKGGTFDPKNLII
jgi:hypothetical protein